MRFFVFTFWLRFNSSVARAMGCGKKIHTLSFDQRLRLLD